jgi:tol-pal system protein YbgF
MSSLLFRAVVVAAFAASLGAATSVAAQESSQPSQSPQQSPFGLFDRLINKPEPKPGRVAQADDADMVLKIDRLEAEVRRLTGTIEQLQYRNQQLETRLQRQEGTAPPVTAAPNSMTSAAQRPQIQSAPVSSPPGAAPQIPAAPPPVITAERPGRGDAFDPNHNPNAPGAPRALGGGINPVLGDSARPEPPVGVPGGRGPGTPLDLSTLATNVPGQVPAGGDVAAQSMNGLPPPPVRNPNATGAVVATLPPTASPKDEYDLGYGYVLRKDYALAEDALGTFLKKYPNDRLAADAQFWLGESLFQRQRYDAAAEQFLAMSTKHAAHPKAADALLRLGESLAALGQKEMSCATLAEVGREQKRVRC